MLLVNSVFLTSAYSRTGANRGSLIYKIVIFLYQVSVPFHLSSFQQGKVCIFFFFFFFNLFDFVCPVPPFVMLGHKCVLRCSAKCCFSGCQCIVGEGLNLSCHKIHVLTKIQLGEGCRQRSIIFLQTTFQSNVLQTSFT